MRPVMSFDDAAWVKSEQIVDNWIYQFCRPEVGAAAAQTLLECHSPGDPVDFTLIGKGSYNISFRMEFDKAPPTVIRFPLPATLRFPDEKIRNEVAFMRYVREHTSIPIPRVIYRGVTSEGQLSLGPFIVMEYLGHESTMYASLNTPGRPLDLRGILDPNIAEAKLAMLYGQFAEILLKLSLLSFSGIGSLNQKDDLTWEVAQRPLTLNMEQMVVMGTLPPENLPGPDDTFKTSASYLESIAETFIRHFEYQRNDSFESADDCRRKFVARRLFRKLAKEKKLTNPSLENGPFKLWCDDLRPSNVIVDQKDHVVGVLDWEFSYAAPVEFAYAPPWWLLIEKPEYWPEGLEDWTKVFECRLEIFVRELIKCEDTTIGRGEMSEAQRLSGPMKDSWGSGDFWIMYAASHSFAFDAIYWQKIDPRFFGPTNDPEDAWKQRLVLLSDIDRAEMETLLARKLEETKNRELAWDCDEYTRFLSDRMTNSHMHRSEAEACEPQDSNCKASGVMDDPSQHSLESVHSIAMFQAILDFAAKKDAIAENTKGVRAQNLEVGGSQIEKGDTEDPDRER
jgi:hypothetical protein